MTHRPIRIMGILNATPDSFSGDGATDTEILIERGLQMIEDGADILDVGGESSRPFAAPVSPEEEQKRVLPVIRGLSKRTAVPVSVDTRNWQVAQAAVDQGARMVNDITGLHDPDMIRVVAGSNVDVVVMHMRGTPVTMQVDPRYEDVIAEIISFLNARIEQAVRSGVIKDRIIIDPGLGFGKKLDHNISIIRHLDRFRSMGYPVLVGPSRKSFIGEILNLPVHDRLEGTLAAVGVCMFFGADIIRVHDVKAVARYAKMLDRLMIIRPAV
ncbi:dihydropteroate synthase [bacterium]|nr:dihydropteroate synthase [candidate division CSSED10-310 bacterium]